MSKKALAFTVAGAVIAIAGMVTGAVLYYRCKSARYDDDICDGDCVNCRRDTCGLTNI